MKYSSYSFSISALDGGKWSVWRLGPALPSWKGPPVPIGQEGRWAQEPVWARRLQEKSFRLYRGSNLDRPVVQSVARYYTDWATRLILKATTIAYFCIRPQIEAVNVYACTVIGYLVYSLAQVFLFCFFGNRLIEEVTMQWNVFIAN
jgi:hypothetical protein